MTTRNRGKRSDDDELFGNKKVVPILKDAVSDMCYLLSRHYPENATSVLVGNRYKLKARQIQMLKGSAASMLQIQNRKEKQLNIQELKNQVLYVDGFNVLIILESLLSGAYIFKGVDGCYRDLSGVHGTYKRVQQTITSIELVASFFKKAALEKLIWIFDKPVSNSGRIKKMLLDFAHEQQLNWEVDLQFNPDKYLVENADYLVSSDAWILEHCKKWFNLIPFIAETEGLNVNLLSFEGAEEIAPPHL